MKKIKWITIILILFSINIYSQDQMDENLSLIMDIANNSSEMVSSFKRSKKFVDFGMTMQKVIDMQRKVDLKYRNIRSTSYYARNKNFTNAYQSAMRTISDHQQSSNDYNKQILSSLAICDQIINILSGKFSLNSISSLLSNGLKLYAKIQTGGAIGGNSTSPPPPDPQKVVDNIAANNELLDKSYKELALAEEKTKSIESYLDTFKIYDENEKHLSESGAFLIY